MKWTIKCFCILCFLAIEAEFISAFRGSTNPDGHPEASNTFNYHIPQRKADEISKDRDFRVVITLTTSPKRILTLGPTLNSLLNLQPPPDLIQLNVPHVFKRTNQTFPTIESLDFLNNPNIRIHRCDDIGPATKLVPTLDTERNPQTLLIVVDDDTSYPSDMVRIMVEGSKADPAYIQVGHCGDPLLRNSEDDFKRDYGWPLGEPSADRRFRCCCQLFEGFGGVGYRRSMFNNETLPFATYLDAAHEDSRCFRSDDLVISNYLTMLGYKGMWLNMKVYQQKLGFDTDALHKLESSGHPYAACLEHLRKIGFASTMRLRSEPVAPPVTAPVKLVDGDLVRCTNQKQVYLVENEVIRAVPDVATFIAHGWDFSQVKVVDETVINQMKRGPDVGNMQY